MISWPVPSQPALRRCHLLPGEHDRQRGGPPRGPGDSDVDAFSADLDLTLEDIGEVGRVTTARVRCLVQVHEATGSTATTSDLRTAGATWATASPPSPELHTADPDQLIVRLSRPGPVRSKHMTERSLTRPSGTRQARQRAVEQATALASFLRDVRLRPRPLPDRGLSGTSRRARASLVAAPTGSGKTIVGEFAVHLALQQGRKCFYTTPIKALSNQKYADLVRAATAPTRWACSPATTA